MWISEFSALGLSPKGSSSSGILKENGLISGIKKRQKINAINRIDATLATGHSQKHIVALVVNIPGTHV